MYQKVLFEMADGNSWTFGGCQSWIPALEKLTGEPAFMYVADTEDFSGTRLFELAFVLSEGFRRSSPALSNLTFQQFASGPWMPRYCSPEWFALGRAIGEMLVASFPEAIAMGRALVVARAQMRRPGVAESLLQQHESEFGAAAESLDTSGLGPESTGLQDVLVAM